MMSVRPNQNDGRWAIGTNTNAPTCGRTTPVRSAHGTTVASCLLNFDCCASFSELLLNGFSFVFVYAFFDWLRCTFDQILGFLQSEARDFTDNLNDADLIAADRCQDDIELGLLFGWGRCGCTAAATGCRRCGHCGGRGTDTKSFFEAFDKLGGFEQRQSLDLFDNALNLRHCNLLTGIIRETFSARRPASGQQQDCEQHRSLRLRAAVPAH